MPLQFKHCNPNNVSDLEPGFIHVVVDARQNTSSDISDNFFELFEAFVKEELIPTFNKIRNPLHIIAKHPREENGVECGEHTTGVDHVHLHYWHGKHSRITTKLWAFIQLHGFRRTWAKVITCFSSYKYIYQKGLQNRLSSNERGLTAEGQPIRMDVRQLEGDNPREHERVSEYCNQLQQTAHEPQNTESRASDSEGGTEDVQRGNIPRRKEKTSTIDFINYHLEKSQAVDNVDFDGYFALMDPACQDFKTHIHFADKHRNYNQLILRLINMRDQRYQQYKFEDLVPVFNEPAFNRRGITFISPAESAYWIKRICYHNGVNIPEFVEVVYRLINRDKPKSNLLVFIGAPSSGKSFLCKSIIRSCSFAFSTNRLNCKTSEFALSDMPTKRIAYFDEPFITQDWFETFKLLSAGEPTLTNIKFGGHVTIPRIPLIVSANRPVWSYLPDGAKSGAADAIKARGPIYNLSTFPALAEVSSTIFFNEMLEETIWASSIPIITYQCSIGMRCRHDSHRQQLTTKYFTA